MEIVAQDLITYSVDKQTAAGKQNEIPSRLGRGYYRYRRTAFLPSAQSPELLAKWLPACGADLLRHLSKMSPKILPIQSIS